MRGFITSDFDLPCPRMDGRCAGPCYFKTCEKDARTGAERKCSIPFQAFSASSTVVPWQCIGGLRVGERRVRGASRQNEIEVRETLHATHASDSVRLTLSRSGCAACAGVYVCLFRSHLLHLGLHAKNFVHAVNHLLNQLYFCVRMLVSNDSGRGQRQHRGHSYRHSVHNHDKTPLFPLALSFAHL